MAKAADLEHLIEGFSRTTELMGEIAKSTAGALKELESGKSSKTNAVQVTISKAGWKKDTDNGYPQYYDIEVEGITVKDRVDMIVVPSSLGTAISCSLCPTSETLDKTIRIRATNVPANDIVMEYWVVKGKEQ